MKQQNEREPDQILENLEEFLHKLDQEKEALQKIITSTETETQNSPSKHQKHE